MKELKTAAVNEHFRQIPKSTSVQKQIKNDRLSNPGRVTVARPPNHIEK